MKKTLKKKVKKKHPKQDEYEPSKTKTSKKRPKITKNKISLKFHAAFVVDPTVIFLKFGKPSKTSHCENFLLLLVLLVVVVVGLVVGVGGGVRGWGYCRGIVVVVVVMVEVGIVVW